MYVYVHLFISCKGVGKSRKWPESFKIAIIVIEQQPWGVLFSFCDF